MFRHAATLATVTLALSTLFAAGADFARAPGWIYFACVAFLAFGALGVMAPPAMRVFARGEHENRRAAASYLMLTGVVLFGYAALSHAFAAQGGVLAAASERAAGWQKSLGFTPVAATGEGGGEGDGGENGRPVGDPGAETGAGPSAPPALSLTPRPSIEELRLEPIAEGDAVLTLGQPDARAGGAIALRIANDSAVVFEPISLVVYEGDRAQPGLRRRAQIDGQALAPGGALTPEIRLRDADAPVTVCVAARRPDGRWVLQHSVFAPHSGAENGRLQLSRADPAQVAATRVFCD